MYDVCCNCGEIVKMNKFLFGSTHICLTEDERRKYAEAIRLKVRQQRVRLHAAKSAV